MDGNTHILLPSLIECDMLPDERSEIPTPDVARHHPYLQHLVDKIPAVDADTSILILLRRDLNQVHKVREQCNGPYNVPFAQRLNLGWVIVGDVCLGRTHRTNSVSAFRTNVLAGGRHSILSPCTSSLIVKEKINGPETPHIFPTFSAYSHSNKVDSLNRNMFQRTQHDEKLGMSIEDELFLHLTDKCLHGWGKLLGSSSAFQAKLAVSTQQHTKRHQQVHVCDICWKRNQARRNTSSNSCKQLLTQIKQSPLQCWHHKNNASTYQSLVSVTHRKVIRSMWCLTLAPSTKAFPLTMFTVSPTIT